MNHSHIYIIMIVFYSLPSHGDSLNSYLKTAAQCSHLKNIFFKVNTRKWISISAFENSKRLIFFPFSLYLIFKIRWLFFRSHVIRLSRKSLQWESESCDQSADMLKCTPAAAANSWHMTQPEQHIQTCRWPTTRQHGQVLLQHRLDSITACSTDGENTDSEKPPNPPFWTWIQWLQLDSTGLALRCC